MANYDFASLKADLTEAVINAYMRRAVPYIVDGSCSDGKFEYIEPGNRLGQAATDLYVTYPGGQWREDGGLIGPSSSASSYEPFDAKGAYADIEAMIDGLVNPFIQAPQPDDFDKQIATLQWAAEKLAVGGSVKISGEGSGTTIDAGNEEVPVYIETIRNELSDLNGVAVNTLRDFYGGQAVQDVLSGHYALAVVAGTLVAGEKAMWEQLQQDLSQVLEFGADSFNQFSKGNEISPGEFIDMVDSITKAAGVFSLPVGAAKAIGTVSKISTIANYFLPPAPRKIDYEIKGGSYQEMVDSLFSAFGDLSKSINDTESAFHDCGVNAVKEVNNNLGAFDNKKPREFLNSGEDGIYNDSNGVRGNEVIINDALKKVALRYELVADHCQDVAKRLDHAAVQGPWIRSADIGGSHSGHYGQFEELVLGLALLLRNAAAEMHGVGEKCLVILSDFTRTEDQVRGRLNRQADRLEREVKDRLRYP